MAPSKAVTFPKGLTIRAGLSNAMLLLGGCGLIVDHIPTTATRAADGGPEPDAELRDAMDARHADGPTDRFDAGPGSDAAVDSAYGTADGGSDGHDGGADATVDSSFAADGGTEDGSLGDDAGLEDGGDFGDGSDGGTVCSVDFDCGDSEQCCHGSCEPDYVICL